MTTSTDRSEIVQEAMESQAAADLTTRYDFGTLPVRQLDPQAGKIGWAVLWLLSVPLPVLLAVYLIWGR